MDTMEAVDRWENFNLVNRRAMFEEYLEGLANRQRIQAVTNYVKDGDTPDKDVILELLGEPMNSPDLMAWGADEA